MSTRTLILAAAVLLVSAVGGFLLLRGASATVVSDVGDGRITVECSGWTGAGDGCGPWGAEILAQGAPSNTFEMEDVVRVRLDRPAFGFASTCVAEYVLSRYPDEVAWTEEVACLTA